MTLIAIQDFGGMVPIKDKAIIPDNMAAYASNTYLYRGTLRGFAQQSAAYTLVHPSTTLSVYRIPQSIEAVLNLATSLWLEFTDPFLSVIRAPMIEDSFLRYYFFPSDKFVGSRPAPYYNTYTNLLAGGNGGTGNGLILGIPTPAVAPGVSYSGGTVGSNESRSYVYTWSSSFQEEGPPSPPTVLTGTIDGTWHITMTAPTSPQTTGRSLAFVNVYRTVTASDGTATYYRIVQLSIGTTSFNDSFIDTQLTSNLVLPSLFWQPPPSDLQGVVAMANGMLAGWSNSREIWFCEAYTPHAWPSPFAVTVDADIIGLAAVGSSLMIMTYGAPWIATGVTPATVTLGKVAAREPCISRGSICAAGEGAYYASPNGLILLNPSGTTNMTQAFLAKEDWTNLGSQFFAASKFSTSYIAFQMGASANIDNGVSIDLLVEFGTFIPHVPVCNLSFSQGIRNVFTDPLTSFIFIVGTTQVFIWNPSDVTSYLHWKWMSKEFRYGYPINFCAAIVYFDIPATVTITPPTSGSRNTSQSQTFNPSTQYLLLTVYADGNQILQREVIKSGELIIMPAGYKATYWQFQWEGQVEVRNMKIATSVKELTEIQVTQQVKPGG